MRSVAGSDALLLAQIPPASMSPTAHLRGGQGLLHRKKRGVKRQILDLHIGRRRRSEIRPIARVDCSGIRRQKLMSSMTLCSY